MSKDTSPSDSEKSSESWEQSVIRRRGEYSLRVKSARLTSASGCSSWPTIECKNHVGYQVDLRGTKWLRLGSAVTREESNWPTPDASNHRDGAVLRTDNNLEQGGFHGVSLHHAMTKYGQAAPANPSTLGSRQGSSEENWVTPRTSGTSTRPNKTTPRQGLTLIEQARANEWRTPTVAEEKKQGTSSQIYLQNQVGATVKQWGTPTARDHKGGRGNEEREYKELTPMVERTQSGKLNPRWVETLMGLPVGWSMPSCASPVTTEQTSCDSSAMESCQQQQNELFDF